MSSWKNTSLHFRCSFGVLPGLASQICLVSCHVMESHVVLQGAAAVIVVIVDSGMSQAFKFKGVGLLSEHKCICLLGGCLFRPLN